MQNTRTTNPTVISVIVGVGQYQTPMIPFFIGVMGYSFVTTALYVKTESVVPCVIFHALINAYAELGFWAATDTRLAYWDGSVRFVVGLAFFAVIVYARKPAPASGAGRACAHRVDAV